MRIITVNIPRQILKTIDLLTGVKGLYPSRSELIRVAVRDWLIKEIQNAKAFEKVIGNPKPPKPIQKSNNICFDDGTIVTLKQPQRLVNGQN